MRYNSAIIATNADFLADILRDTLRDYDVKPVLVMRNENELLAGIKNGCPRFVFLENCFRGQGTEEFILRLVKRNRDVRIVVWSAMAVKPVIAARYILAGAESYFSLRDRDIADIVKLIAGGRRYCPPDVQAVIGSETYFPDMTGKLTLREIEIIKLSVTKKNNREIAGALGISVATVKFHKASIYRKCGGNTPVDILRYGLVQGVICPEDIGGTE
ncbi:MAG: LuxR C-terminal-related transcriptional regulator [Treponema sp.]|jgi:DNA-binding NarL/FixJ family response regulator|nr:LuxR C-terminal-related transcriptional regulator [Treponema sp.]